MRILGMLILAVGLAAAAWWWLTIEMPRREQARQAATQAAAIQAERANALYRWHDANGTLHISQEPPKDQRYERVSKTPKEGIEVHGERQ
ncbi:MAG: DUF4124 domain-containing protein [Thermomonas sp.]|jgi:hypothetical protein|uniref:DUF4124 domain-containing protein n=1 Tax=Thermomonas sp. TaxID=1971895 RepID=UPI001EC022F1|nr:DUF4124 domain-containing protein [Thermomonas sp.]MBV2208693.1 DUF4124 domain-containing protein [Thermomonas sp.]